MSFLVNEIFSSLQGEGVRAGTSNIFIRFSKCNMTCRKETHGFDCDTEFESGTRMTLEELIRAVRDTDGRNCEWVVLTGGEPALQITEELVQTLHDFHFRIAVETNGSIELPPGIDWITVSPKTAEHTLRQLRADEVKYVRSVGQAIPKTQVIADHQLLSPAWDNGFGDNLKWCIELVKQNPSWRLSCQQHKYWKVR